MLASVARLSWPAMYSELSRPWGMESLSDFVHTCAPTWSASRFRILFRLQTSERKSVGVSATFKFLAEQIAHSTHPVKLG
jgi:phosphoserine phosphatase